MVFSGSLTHTNACSVASDVARGLWRRNGKNGGKNETAAAFPFRKTAAVCSSGS
jgi:hypothetical protein